MYSKTGKKMNTSSYWLAPGKAVSPAPAMVLEKEQVAGNTTPEDFIAFAIQHFKLDPQVFLHSRSNRRPAFVSIKHMVRHYLYFHYVISLREVGILTCKADHSTVVHSCEKHLNYVKYDSEYRKGYEAFQKEARARGFHRREGWKHV